MIKLDQKLSRDEAVAMTSAQLVDKLDSENCEPTNRVGYNGECQGDALTEWSSSLEFVADEGVNRTLTAYYYTDNDDDKTLADNDLDGSLINWEIDHYIIY